MAPPGLTTMRSIQLSPDGPLRADARQNVDQTLFLAKIRSNPALHLVAQLARPRCSGAGRNLQGVRGDS